MSYHFGIHPWDIEKLTFDEISYYEDALRDIQREASKAS